MDEIALVQFIQKTIKERRRSALDILENNGISSMEQYQNLMGEINNRRRLYRSRGTGP